MSTIYSKLEAPERARVIMLVALASAMARKHGMSAVADFLEDFLVRLAEGRA